MKTQTYITWFTPGSFVSNELTQPVDTRTLPKAASIPKNAFAFRFFDRVETTADDGELLSGPVKNISGMHYFGKSMTYDEVAALPGDMQILLSNMRVNGYERVVRTDLGNFQPLNPGDVVMERPVK